VLNIIIRLWKPAQSQGESAKQGLLRVFEFLLTAKVAVFVDETAGLGQIGLRRIPRDKDNPDI
jgi:hypothetical protein